MRGHVALLRGVNVGKAKRVAMADLRELLSELGYESVATLLNSGNVVFRGKGEPAAIHAAAIRRAIERRLGLDVPVVVKSTSELGEIVEECDVAGSVANFSQLLVGFVQEPAALPALERVRPLVAASEWFKVGRGACYLYCGNGILESKAAVALLGKGREAVTTRNWSTVLKLQALVRARDAGG